MRQHMKRAWYDFDRINSPVRMSPAMIARLETVLGDIVQLIEAHETQLKAA
jgi:hypothetical protein